MPTASASYQVYDCFERQAVDLPLASVLGMSGTLNVLPEVRTRGYFDIDFRGDRLTFVAGRYVGLIPISDKICINVKPKVEIGDLVRLIAIAGGEVGVLRTFTRGYTKESQPAAAVIAIVLRTLVEQLREVAEQGLLKRYEKISGEGVLRPRINFNKTLQRQWSRGQFTTVSWSSFTFSTDNDANRLIKFTLWYCGRLLQSTGMASDLSEELNQIYEYFDHLPLDHSKEFVHGVRSSLVQRAFPDLRHYYYDICNTCLFLIGNHSISLKVRGTDIDLLSFVLNLEDVFERYVRNILRAGLPAAVDDIRVLDGNREGKSYLFRDSKAMEVRPDVVVTKGYKPVLIADVKYKPKLNEADRYQLIAHAYSCGVQRALFVLPSFEAAYDGLIRRGQIRDTNGIEIYEYHMRLDTTLEDQEASLSREVAALLADL